MSTKNPWITHSTKEVFKNAWFRIIYNDVTRPDGNPGTYTFLDKTPATGVVALTPENEIYLVGQFRYATNCYSWEIIEGGVDPGETPLECIKRELKEEAGLIAKKWVQLCPEIHLSNCVTSEISYLYLAQDLEETQAQPEGTELLEVKKVSLKTALDMVESGEIKDALSIIAIMKVCKKLGIS